MAYSEIFKDYLEDLSSKNPVPGGGSSSGIVSAIGCGLASMAANFSIGKDKPADNQEELKEIIIRLRKIREELAALTDKDIEVYQNLRSALKEAGKDFPGREEKINNVQEELEQAVMTPFRVCRLCRDALVLSGRLSGIGNLNLITDLGEAAVFLEAGFVSAEFNVRINLKDYKKLDKKSGIEQQLDIYRKDISLIKEKILALVSARLTDG